MFLIKVCGVITATFMAASAFAQQPTAKPQLLDSMANNKTVTYASAADVKALIAQAKKERKNNSALVVGKLMQLAPYEVDLEYREKTKPLADVGLHAKFAELIYIIQGSGTLVTGGTMAADRMSIEGGESQKFAAGDFIFIPENTPHWISKVNQTIALMTVHVPRSAPAK